MRLSRRSILAAGLAMPFVRPASAQQNPTVIKMGALKLIHSITPYFYERFTPAGYKIEVIPFESPTEAKNAVVTKSVEFATFGIAAGILGAAAREPVTVFGSACNKGMAVVAGKASSIENLKDLRGKKVAIWPGSTQEVFILERLRMEGMTIKDIQSVRVSFSEMHTALARGDVDAYVGAEPAPGVSVSSGVGKIVEYPYSTPMGSLNMILGTHTEMVTAKPELVRMILDIQRKASAFAMANREEMITMSMARLGQKREALEVSEPNVELNWQMTPLMVQQVKTYSEQMLELKQIRALPNYDTFISTKFSDEIAKSA
jgi:NitT/TauT family transport system substrate-binding protein